MTGRQLLDPWAELLPPTLYYTPSNIADKALAGGADW